MAWNFLYKSLELPRLPPEQGSWFLTKESE
jgi:hypothetical protein